MLWCMFSIWCPLCDFSAFSWVLNVGVAPHGLLLVSVPRIGSAEIQCTKHSFTTSNSFISMGIEMGDVIHAELP